jgi:NADPH:quinone reductase
MRAWRVHGLGDPSAMTLDDVPVPTPGEGQLLVKVRAAALNFPDVLMAAGLYQVRPPLPYVPGIELCGEVDGTGQRVIGAPSGGSGAFADFALMDADRAWPVPEGMPDEKAAALYITYQTSHVGLHRRAHLQAGEWLLVHAGAGGVGSAAVQLGKAAGATVIGVVGGAEKAEVARGLGADLVVDRHTEDFVAAVKQATGGRGADVVYDPVGGEAFKRSTKCIAFEGRILVIGFASGDMPTAALNHALIKNYSIVGLHWGLYGEKDPDAIRRCHEDLTKLAEQGVARPLVGERLGLDDVADGVQRLADGATVGRVVFEA